MLNISHKNKKAKLTKFRTSVSILRNVMFWVTFQNNYVMLGLKTFITTSFSHISRLNNNMQFSNWIYYQTFSIMTKIEFFLCYILRILFLVVEIKYLHLGDAIYQIPNWHPWCLLLSQRRCVAAKSTAQNTYLFEL